MAKTQEELKELKQEYETLTTKLKELTEDELLLVTGGTDFQFVIDENDNIYNEHFYPKKDQPDFEPKF